MDKFWFHGLKFYKIRQTEYIYSSRFPYHARISVANTDLLIKLKIYVNYNNKL